MKFNEILVKNILNEYIYKNTLVGGDSQKLKLPDLYNKEKTIGIEVTMCELDVDYCLQELKNECKNIKDDIKSCILIRNKYEKKEIFSRLKEKIGYNIDDENSHIFILNFENNVLKDININKNAINIGFTPYIFAKMYENKLKKLNSGNYDGVKSKNLAVSSLLRERSSESAKNCFRMFDLSNSMYVKKVFDKVYLILKRGIYIFGQDKILKFIKIDEKKLKKLVEKSKEEFKEKRKNKK